MMIVLCEYMHILFHSVELHIQLYIIQSAAKLFSLLLSTKRKQVYIIFCLPAFASTLQYQQSSATLINEAALAVT